MGTSTAIAPIWFASTKLSAPARRHDALLRARLVDEIGKMRQHARMVLISAPAGAGKTTLLAELPHAFPDSVWSWLLLDEEDNDPSRFAAALLASLVTQGVTIAEDRLRPNDPRAVITAIVNHASQMDDRQIAMVIDDLHVITERSVFEVLDYLVDRLPPNLKLVLGTRHDPPMALARRRVRGELCEIRLSDLSFTVHETAALVNQCLGLNLDSSEVSQLHSRTEGWAAGVRLLATSLSQLPANRSALLGGMQGSRRIFDFLAEEVLDRQPSELRDFLLETSILSGLRPDVCDALTGRHDSLRILDDLYRRNLYVVAADEAETSFRYHDLFADFLRERLRRERAGDWARLHERAARSEITPRDRLRHWLAAGNWESAAAEIEAIGPEYAQRGFVVTLQRWISEIPEPVRLAHPRVLYLLGHAIWTQAEFSLAEPFLEQALEGFRRTGDVVGQGEALVALANSALMNNRFDQSRERVREALTFDIPRSSLVQVHTSGAWDAIYQHDWVDAEKHLAQVLALLEAGEGVTNPLAAQLVLFSEGIPGYVPKVEAVAAAMGRRRCDPPQLADGIYHLLYGATRIYRGDPAGANREAQRAMTIARNIGEIGMIIAALSTSFAVTAAMTGHWADMEAWATDGASELKYGQIARNWRLHFQLLEARARWNLGNLEGLRETFENAMQPNAAEAPAAKPYRPFIRGMLRMAEHSYAQAEQAFRDAWVLEETFKVTRAVCSARVLLAYCLLTRGHADEAMDVFRPYLEEAEQSACPGILMRENPSVVPLLRLAYQRKIRREYAGEVLRMLGAAVDAVEASGREALSDRELEVLRVLAEGSGNKEIAVRLFVSEATVKTHVQHIMRKLDAETRTQAVAKARELMLL